MLLTEIATTVKGELARRRTTPYRASLEAGLPGNAIRYVLEGRATKSDRLAEICRALGLEFYIGPPRDGAAAESPGEPPPAAHPPEHDRPPEPSSIAPLERIPKPVTDMLALPEGASADAVLAAMQARIRDRGTAHASPAATLDEKRLGQLLDSKLKSETRALEAKLAKKLDALAERLPSPAEASGIRKLHMRIARDVHAAGGIGEEIFDEATDRVMIAADDLPRNLDLERVVAIRALGCSMEPTIRTDDILVLDLDQAEPREGALFVVRTGTGLVVKRLQQDGGAWTMVSDADDRDPRPVAEEDRIVGRVVWFGPEGAIVVGG